MVARLSFVEGASDLVNNKPRMPDITFAVRVSNVPYNGVGHITSQD